MLKRMLSFRSLVLLLVSLAAAVWISINGLPWPGSGSTNVSETSSSIIPAGTLNDQHGIISTFAADYTQNGRVVQVDLTNYPKVSQFWSIDSSVFGYGKNACGLVAAASAMGGTNWVPLVGAIANAAGDNYGQYTGIQPSNYVAALQQVFGAQNVTASNNSTLDQLYQELQQGKIVIVDIKVNAITEYPSAYGLNYAHFARVLGIDSTTQQIYIQNTLDGPSYWTLSLQDLLRDWVRPETTSSLVPDPWHAEDVTNWQVILNPPPSSGL